MSAYVQDLHTGLSGTTATTYVITLAVAPAAGATLLAEFAWNGSGTVAATGVTDSKGNTWTQAATNKDSTSGQVTSIGVWTTRQNVAALGVGDTITLTFTSIGNTNQKLSGIRELSPGCVVDKTAVNATTSNSTSGTTGTTAATVQASEIAWASFATGVGQASWTKDATYSLPTTNLVNPTGRTLLSAYKNLAATGTQVSTATFATTTSYASTIVTLTVPAAASLVVNPRPVARNALLRM